MSGPYRRSLPELIGLYKLEPTLRDLFVEGTSDQALFSWFFRQTGKAKARIYPVNTVNISNSFPVAEGGGGEKGRVLSLALALANALPNGSQNVVCLIDRDIIDISVPMPVCRTLLVTEHSCIESYAFDDTPLSKFFRLYFSKELTRGLLKSICETLATLFFLRAAKFELNLSAGWVDDFTDEIRLKGEVIIFDRAKFAEKIATRSGLFTRQQLETRATEIAQRKKTQPLSVLHKKDVIRLLSWLGREFGCDHAICRTEPLAKSLLLSLDLNTLERAELFAYLGHWAN